MHVRAIITLTLVLQFTVSCAENASIDQAQVQGIASSEICDPNHLVVGCILPKPKMAVEERRYPYVDPRVTQRGCQPGTVYASYGNGCMDLEDVKSVALGYYAIYGQEYYDAYPLYTGYDYCQLVELDLSEYRFCFL